MTALAVLLLIVAVVWLLGSMALPSQVGKPRVPLDAGTVFVVMVWRLAIVALLIVSAITFLTAS